MEQPNLLSDLDLFAEIEELRRTNTRLERQVAGLRSDNERLERELAALACSVLEATAPVRL